MIGLPSVGKSSLARYVMRFAKERDMCLSGVTLIQAKGLHDLDAFKYMMVRNLSKKEGQDDNLDKVPSEATLSSLLQYVHERQKDDQKLLVCLDNAEDLIHSAKQELKIFIEKMLVEIPNLYVLITSRTQLGFFEASDFTETYFLVEPLRTKASVDLFTAMSPKEIGGNEVIELLENTPSYPYRKLGHEFDPFTDKDSFSSKRTLRSKTSSKSVFLNETVKEILRKKLLNPAFRKTCLSRHEMFELMGGNPHSITLMATVRNLR
jgi:hypothetical protein